MNSLLHSIRSFKVGDPAFTSESKIHFIGSKDFTNVNFFQNITNKDPKYNFSDLQVYINGELTGQVANSISASANDDIVIKATSGKYPWFSSAGIDCIKSIKEPLPLMHQANGDKITSFNGCFWDCSRLTSIPTGLFDKNTQVTSFSDCFAYCSSLTVNVQIGSTASSVDVGTFAIGTKEKGTVYCREGSAAYTAFSESIDANVNVLTY